MDREQLTDLEELDTTMSFVVKVRQKAWIKGQTAKRREADRKASDSQIVREILDAAIASDDERATA